MIYDKVIQQLNDMLRRSKNDKEIVLTEDDKKAIEESKVAISRLMGYYPKDFNQN